MRIKCPNTDIYLELPSDRTDMKFTCPACQKVHRVTVSITTPGEEPPPPANTRTIVRAEPPMPKKYATGAYKPVVDVPIDANFVLLDENSAKNQGIDLGRATTPPPPRMDSELAGRKTEIFDTRPQADKTTAAAPPLQPPAAAESAASSEETVRDDQPEEKKISARHLWNETADDRPRPAKPSGSAARSGRGRRAGASGRMKRSASPFAPPRGGGRVVLWLLLAAALAGGGYLAWQQHRYDQHRLAMNGALADADAAWRRGDVAAAGALAGQAESELQSAESFNTPRRLWNGVAESTGLFAPLVPGVTEAEARIRDHRDRQRVLSDFHNTLDVSDPEVAARHLADGVRTADADAPLAAAMRNTVVTEVVSTLRREGADATPEEALALAARYRRGLEPALPAEQLAGLDRWLDEFAGEQRQRLAEMLRQELHGLALDAAAGNTSTLSRYMRLQERLRDAPAATGPAAPPEMADASDRAAIEQLDRLAEIVAEATAYTRSVLSRPESEEEVVDDLQQRAEADDQPHPAMAAAAAGLVDATRAQADDLVTLRGEIYGRIQNELRRNRTSPGVRLAWSMLRMGFGDTDLQIDPASIKYDTRTAAMTFRFRDLPVEMAMGPEDYENSVRARVAGYGFRTGWALLMHKPLTWMADVAAAMRKAGVDPARYPEWEILEGPGAPLALSIPADVESDVALANFEPAASARQAFYNGVLLPVRELPASGDSRAVAADFRRAAEKLHDGIMGDESISQSLRQALKPILMGTFQNPDARDYFDSAFCRRLVEADYLETYIAPMPPERQRELDEYRAALGRLEAGSDEFSIDIPSGRLVAVLRMDADLGAGKASDQDPETGEALPRYDWRLEKDDGGSAFFSAMPSRFYYAFMLADHYQGRHRTRPAGAPDLTEVWHMTLGRIASYAKGAEKADGDVESWNEAVALDSSGRFDSSTGEAGWSFPMHVLVRDDQGDPLLIATNTGTVQSPDFSNHPDAEERRRAEDLWLDATARTFATPGELGLIFHQFFRYCSDSPMPELPNLIGSHYGLSDTHQTVYESLERRWVGRLIGDCDDLAEFFQVLTRRQGKLSHVMQLPGHAACGYVERDEEDNYRFVVLQTGPVMQFVAPTLNEVVETAYRAFDRGEGISHMTTDAVPLLLRFANEETRTPFVLSARIYEDADYAETMIQVQSYWHEHVYSAALEVMEGMVAEDQEIGNIKELGSLYERVGMYDKSETLRRRELEMVKDNNQAAISTLLEIVQLHFQDKDRNKALSALEEMETRMRDMIRRDDAPEFFRAMTFRSFWAMHLSRLGQAARAWDLVRYDALMTKQQLGRVADPVLRTMVVMYERMCAQRDAGADMSTREKRAMDEVRRELEEAFGRGYFRDDDAYNAIIARYFVMGRYAVADIGREAGLRRLMQDGPYPDGPRDQKRRSRGVDDEDWEWLRIAPQLYLAMGQEMLDQDEYPELYDPEGARPLLESVARAIARGTGLGSDVAGGDDGIKAEMTLAFLNRDLAAFRRCMATVKEKDYASLYDDAAMTFGLQCSLIPLSEFPAWIEAFREFFPGSQHYFKVVYRAIDKEVYDHALLMAEATARFFPDKPLLGREAEFIRGILPDLKARKLNRAIEERTGEATENQAELQPAA